jgi:hypothetical protein
MNNLINFRLQIIRQRFYFDLITKRYTVLTSRFRLECAVVFVVGTLDHNYVYVVVLWSNYCFYFDAGQLAISQYPEGPATGHLDTDFPWFPWVQERMLRSLPPFQVASTCFSCSPTDINSVVTNCLLSYYIK